MATLNLDDQQIAVIRALFLNTPHLPFPATTWLPIVQAIDAQMQKQGNGVQRAPAKETDRVAVVPE